MPVIGKPTISLTSPTINEAFPPGPIPIWGTISISQGGSEPPSLENLTVSLDGGAQQPLPWSIFQRSPAKYAFNKTINVNSVGPHRLTIVATGEVGSSTLTVDVSVREPNSLDTITFTGLSGVQFAGRTGALEAPNGFGIAWGTTVADKAGHCVAPLSDGSLNNFTVLSSGRALGLLDSPAAAVFRSGDLGTSQVVAQTGPNAFATGQIVQLPAITISQQQISQMLPPVPLPLSNPANVSGLRVATIDASLAQNAINFTFVIQGTYSFLFQFGFAANVTCQCILVPNASPFNLEPLVEIQVTQTSVSGDESNFFGFLSNLIIQAVFSGALPVIAQSVQQVLQNALNQTLQQAVGEAPQGTTSTIESASISQTGITLTPFIALPTT